MTAGCIVQLGDLTAGGEHDHLAAVTELEAEWGREDPWAVTEPGAASLTVLDRTGDWVETTHLPETPVRIIRANDGRVLWRGFLTNAEARRVQVPDPLTRQRTTAWEVKLRALDPLGLAGRMVLTGPSTENTPEGQGGWPEADIYDRCRHMRAAGADAVFDIGEMRPIGSKVQHGGGTAIPILRPRAASTRASVLSLLQEIGELYPGSGLVYRHDTNQVAAVVLPLGGPVKLEENSSGQTIRGGFTFKPGYSPRWYLPASVFQYDPDEDLRLTPRAAIGSYTLKYTSYKRVVTDGKVEHKHLDSVKTFRVNGATTSAGLEKSLNCIVLHPEPFGHPPTWDVFENSATFVDWHLYRSTELAAALNGRVTLPAPVALLDHPRAASLAADHPLWRTWPTEDTFMLTGSVWSDMPAAPRQLVILGGTLMFDPRRGWRHRVVFSPAIREQRANLSLAQMFGPGTRGRLDRWIVRVNDLETITEGIP